MAKKGVFCEKKASPSQVFVVLVVANVNMNRIATLTCNDRNNAFETGRSIVESSCKQPSS